MSNPTNPSASKPNFLDSFDEGQLTEWLAAHGKNIIYILGALIILLIAFYSFGSSQKAKQEQDYIQAAQDVALFVNAKTPQETAAATEAYQRLNDIMTRHPELHAAYDGIIAQTLLNRSLITEAKPIALSTLKRISSDDLPFYGDFARTTLLISEQKDQEALASAQSLQKQMIDAINTLPVAQRSFGEELFAMNLFRIGMLQQKLGDNAAELQTWQEWKQYAALDSAKTLPAKVDARAFRAVIQQLAIGTLSIPDYIAYREKALTKLKG